MSSFFSEIQAVNKANRSLILPITCRESSVVLGNLVPITIKDIDDNLLITRLTEWRNKHMDKFFTSFTATPERTRHWLNNFLSNSSTQMLFKIYENDVFVGHLGFKDFDDHTVTLDNAIKGITTKNPRLFVDAHHVLSSWLFASSNIDKIKGYVFTDNIPAIMMNKKIGWRGWKRLPVNSANAFVDESTPFVNLPGSSKPKKYCYELLLESDDILT